MNWINRRGLLHRRAFLRGTGVALVLPWLEAMSPSSLRVANAGDMSAAERPRRAVFCFWGLGINGRDYTPKDLGLNYAITPTLEPLRPFQKDFTVISGLMLTHSGGHTGDRTFLTGTNTRNAGSKLRISVDQELAEFIGKRRNPDGTCGTRFLSLSLGIERGTGFGEGLDKTLSWNRNGLPIPAENRPHVLFDHLFRTPSASDFQEQHAAEAFRTSVLDNVKEDYQRLRARLGKQDQEKLAEYAEAIRDLEKRLERDRQWQAKKRPQVPRPAFSSRNCRDFPGPKTEPWQYSAYQRLMWDIIALALQTDSTRVIAYMCRRDLHEGTGSFRSRGNPWDYHTLTHHGEEPKKLEWYSKVDCWYMKEWAYFLKRLSEIKEGIGSLLDHTMVVWGSSGGTVNAHNRDNLPTMLCGGSRVGIKHCGHIRKQDVKLGSLWQTIIDRMGMKKIPENFQGGQTDGTIKEVMA